MFHTAVPHSDCVPRTERPCVGCRGPALAMLCGLVLIGAWLEGGVAVVLGGRTRIAQGSDPRPGPGGVPRERDHVQPFVSCVGRGTLEGLHDRHRTRED